ncbi:MAG TPA: peptide ABC transporter substrate-binding protein [Candidatus Binatia bacterium]|nr:peptide ABC transporter substrate-binding protein [Candidatus Binatia bacterium]
MSHRKRQSSSKLTGAAVTRRQFMKLAGVSVAATGVVSWPNHLLFAAQPARKRIVIHGERQVTSLGYHNRRETEHVSMVDAGLVTQNPVTLERVPVLAEELPSVKKGTWKIDTQKKTMITVYKLRPGLTWHDGKPYTSKDFEFGWQIAKHPEFPMPDRLVPELISKIETPDDRTIVIHWNDLYNEAYAIQYTHVRAFPRHLLQEAFTAGDMKAFANLPFWNKNFVGVGPYRVVEWDAGTRMELEAFKDFTLGRPKIERVTYKTVEDTNTNLAAVLAGEVDLCMRSTISFDGAMILREQWEKPGKGKIYISPASWSWLNLSRDNPWFSDVKVRRALLHAIDREAMVQNLFKGEKIVSHVPLSRVRKSYKKALAAATLYKYEPETAKKLLAEAGWKPGSDGVLVNSKGERMEFEFRVTAERRDHEQAQAIVADYWKKVGVRTNIKNLPNRLLNAAENRNRWPGAFIGTHNVTVEEWQERFHTKNIPSAENKFALENVSGWNDPRKDAILDELNSIITPARSEQLQLEFIKMFSDALPHLPLYYSPEVLVAKKGLTGITPRQESGGQNSSSWNMYQWDKA